MDKLKRNGFWVGLVVVLAVIVLAYVYYVEGERSARARASKALANLKTELDGVLSKPEEIPSDKQVEAYAKRLKELQADLEQCKSWYKSYDDSLEAWFQGLPAQPDPGVFGATYDAKRQDMETALKAAGIQIGIQPMQSSTGAMGPVTGGLNWPMVGSPNAPSIKDIQKQYWVRERVSNALLAIQQATNNKGVSTLEEIIFSPHPKKQPPDDYPSWPPFPEGLPNNYGMVITCGIRVEMSNAQAPAFLKMLLEKDEPSPKLLTHLRGVRITITNPMQDKVPETIDYTPDQNPAQLKAQKEQELKQKHWQPKPVRVFVTYDVFDFDGEKLAKPFAAAAGAPK